MGEEDGICPGDIPIPASCPASQVEVRWDDWAAAYFIYPVATQLAASMLFFLALGPLYRRHYRNHQSFQHFIRDWVGFGDRLQVRRPGLIVAAYIAQLVSAPITIAVWVFHCYSQTTYPSSRLILLLMAMVDLFPWAMSRLENEFRVSELWSVSALVDAFTIVPSFSLVCNVEISRGSADWLSTHFLRAFALLTSFQRIEKPLHWLGHRGVMVQMLLVLFLRLFSMIIAMAGTLFTSEVLGDPKFLRTCFLETEGGDKLSMLQMFYWIVVSMTTVGYGDFSPRTTLSRVLTTFFIVLGFWYIFTIQYSLTEAWLHWREGSGSYRPKQRGGSVHHVVVILCVRGRAVQCSSMVAGFLREILHSNVAKDWPHVVILSPVPWDTNSLLSAGTFEDFLLSQGFSTEVRKHVTFIVGELTSQSDLERAAVGSSSMTFLLSDVNSSSPEEDDEQNIFTHLAIQEFYPHARLRLMLLKPQSKELAVQSGIEISRCFALRELKANILAQNIRCHGIVPMITGMLKSVDAVDKENAIHNLKVNARREREVAANLSGRTKTMSKEKSHAAGGAPRLRSAGSSTALGSEVKSSSENDSWLRSYMQGLEKSLYGFELSERYANMLWGELVSAVYAETGAILVATYEGDRIRVCPQPRDRVPLCTGQIMFAIAPEKSCLSKCMKNPQDPDRWRQSFLRSQNAQTKKAAREGPHVSAAQLMGQYMKGTLLQQDDMMPPFSDFHRLRSRSIGASSESEDSVSTDSTPDPRGKWSVSTDHTVTRKLLAARRQSSEGGTEAELQSVRALRQSLVHTGQELIVVVVCHTGVWQEVRTFVQAMRAKYLPFHSPIVILSSTSPPPRLLEGISVDVFFVEGDCTKAKMLIECGMLEAGAVVVMTGELKKDDEEGCATSAYRDARTILCAQEIECWCGVSKREVFTTYELQDSWSARQLPKLMMKPMINLERYLAERAFSEDSEDEFDEPEPEVRAASRLATAFGRKRPPEEEAVSAAVQEEKKEACVDTSILFHPRFAAGQVFSPELWGAMLGRMFYMPAILDLVEALVIPSRRGQTAYPWQIAVPARYVGRPFKDLLRDFTLSKWNIPDTEELQQELGMTDTAHPNGRSPKSVLQPTEALSKHFWRSRRSGLDPREGPAVPVAIYRKREEWNSARSTAESRRNSKGNTTPGNSAWMGTWSRNNKSSFGFFPPASPRATASPRAAPQSPRPLSPRMPSREPPVQPPTPTSPFSASATLCAPPPPPAMSKTPSAPTAGFSGFVKESTLPAQGTGGHKYIILAPDPQMELREDDLVIVFGSRRFGRVVQKLQLLRGGENLGPSHDSNSDNHDADMRSMRRMRTAPLPGHNFHGPGPQRRSGTGDLNSLLFMSTPAAADDARRRESAESGLPAEDTDSDACHTDTSRKASKLRAAANAEVRGRLSHISGCSEEFKDYTLPSTPALSRGHSSGSSGSPSSRRPTSRPSGRLSVHSLGTPRLEPPQQRRSRCGSFVLEPRHSTNSDKLHPNDATRFGGALRTSKTRSGPFREHSPANLSVDQSRLLRVPSRKSM